MCLELAYAEALKWKMRGADLVLDAENKAQKMEIDPVLRFVPDISRLVSAVDSVKKRHGPLIEEALVFAISCVPGWSAERQTKVSYAGENFRLDCLAHHAGSQTLYVFECKRGHGVGDSAALRSIDQRLAKVVPASTEHARRRGLSVKSVEVFIISFYGKKWNSRYPIFNAHEAATIFPPCAVRFADELRKSSENLISRHVGERVNPGPRKSATSDTLFDRLELMHVGENARVRFDEDGWTVISATH